MADWLFSALGLMAVFQLLLLSLFLFTHKKGNAVSHGIFAFFLLANAIVIADVVQFVSGAYVYFPYLLFIGLGFILLYGPLLYLFTRSVVESHFKLKSMDLVHLLPFLGYWILFFFRFQPMVLLSLTMDGLKEEALTFMGNLEGQAIYMLLHFQVIGYTSVALVRIQSFRRNARLGTNDVEGPATHPRLPWLRFILIGFLTMWSVHLVKLVLSGLMPVPNYIHSLFNILAMILYFVFVNFAVYLSLRRPEIFDDIRPKYAKSGLTPIQVQNLLQRLVEHFESDKPHLNPSLTLNEVAQTLNVPARQISQAMHASDCENFLDFVNFYRIKEAKLLLRDPNDPGRTVLEVVYQVGFNSKSAFNGAFKRHTGVTPTVFKNQTAS